MSDGRYPKLGSANKLYQRNQFGRTRKHPVITCYACEREAMHRVVIQTSWFRSEDNVVYVCDPHNAALKRGEWEILYKVKDTAKG
jgi:hypothetical protein